MIFLLFCACLGSSEPMKFTVAEKGHIYFFILEPNFIFSERYFFFEPDFLFLEPVFFFGTLFSFFEPDLFVWNLTFYVRTWFCFALQFYYPRHVLLFEACFEIPSGIMYNNTGCAVRCFARIDQSDRKMYLSRPCGGFPMRYASLHGAVVMYVSIGLQLA